ncbi:MAG: DUF3826 domain-containing protein [Bacteroidales bacterium]|nr:DUF3826 domain-containing protein [Bacteroidales bacterium]
MKNYLFILGIAFLTSIIINAQEESPDPDTAYTRVLIERVGKFLPDVLSPVADPEKYIRVRNIVVQQYKDLANIHDTRDAKVKEIKAQAGLEKEAINLQVDAVKMAATVQLYELHAAYIGRLASELTAEQVVKVKDGMTYSVMPRTYQVYMEMLPDLTDEQKRFIYACLVEARELAMDRETSDKKHATFGKYKGRINNYLSKAGIDLKQAEKDMLERKKAEEEKQN